MSLDDAIVSLRRYADHGVPTGGFLQAVLENDLFGAMCRADESSRANLQEICRYVYNDMPGGCWGSKLHIERWIAHHMLAREIGPEVTQ